MKKILMAVVAVALVAMAGSAMAADTATLTVQANVVGTCKFTGAKAATMDFLNLDPSVGGNASANASLEFWCTKGVNETFTIGNGANFNVSRRMTNGIDFIPYSLTPSITGPANGGPTAPRQLNLAGVVNGADYTGVSAGAYTDSVRIDITP